MSLGTMTRDTDRSNDGGEPIFFDHLVFDADDDYSAGGTTGFDALVKAKLGDNRQVIAVIPQECAGYDVRYSTANGGTLKMYEEGADGGAADEVTAGDKSGTSIRVLVISK